MSDEKNEDARESAHAEQDAHPAGPRLWPAVLIVAAHLAVLAYSLQTGPLIQRAIGLMLAPGLAAILLSVWWMRSSGVPRKDRMIGLGLFLASVIWIVVVPGVSEARLLMFLLPSITFGVVGLLVLSARMQWPVRRRLAAALVMGCAGVFTMMQIDYVRGDLVPVLAWRWEPTSEEASANATWDSESSGTATLPAQVGAGDWAEFRGPQRDNRVPGVTFATNWDDTPPQELWRIPVGLGWSSFSVVGDYFFTQEQRGQDEVVVCYLADTGEQVWVNKIAERFDEAMGAGPRATPTYDNGKLFTFGATGILQCLDASTGETVWKRDARADCDARLPVWGFASSPLVTGDLVIVFTGGGDGKAVAAYDRVSGDLKWTAGDGTHGYSSGQIANFSGVPQVLFTCDVGIQSFAPEDGKLLWEHRWTVSTNPRCVQPLVADGQSVMIGTAGGKGTRSLNVQKEGDAWVVEEQWTTRRFKPYFNDFVYHEGHGYGYDGSMFACIDAATGERLWKGARYGGQVLLLPDMDMLLVLSEKGEVVLIEATPEEHDPVARFKAIRGKTWNHPVIANGRLYVRNSQEAACFELP